MAKQMSEHGSGSFSATTKVNPRESCKAVTTRRGTVVGLKDESEFSENKTNEGVVKISDKKVVEKKKKNVVVRWRGGGGVCKKGNAKLFVEETNYKGGSANFRIFRTKNYIGERERERER